MYIEYFITFLSIFLCTLYIDPFLLLHDILAIKRNKLLIIPPIMGPIKYINNVQHVHVQLYYNNIQEDKEIKYIYMYICMSFGHCLKQVPDIFINIA